MENLTNVTVCLYDHKRYHLDKTPNMFHFILHVPVLSIIVVIGLIVNTLSFVILGMEGRTKKTSPVFILRTIALTDNCSLMFNFVKYVLSETFRFTGRLEGIYEVLNRGENVTWFLTASVKVFSMYLVILMTTDRWIACCRPLQSRTLCSRRNAAIATVILLVFSMAVSVPKMWTYEIQYLYDNCTDRVRPLAKFSDIFLNIWYKNIYIVAQYFIINFSIPMLSLIIMNYKIVIAVRQSAVEHVRMRTTKGGSKSSKRKSTHTQQDVETIVTKRAILVALAFFILEGPSIMFHLVTLFYAPTALEFLIAVPILYDLSAVNNCINFFLYCLVGKKFRNQLKDLCCRGRGRRFPQRNRTFYSSSSTNGGGEMTEVSLIKNSEYHS